MKNYKMKSLLAVSAMALVLAGGYGASSAWAANNGYGAQRVFAANDGYAQDASAADSAIYAAGSTYVKYQTLSYTDAAGNDIPVMVLANESETKFNLQFDYYGTDANLTAEKAADGQYRITNGDFFQTAGQNLIKTAVAQGNWTYNR